MCSDKISGQLTVHASEHPELYRFMSGNKNKQMVSRTLQTMLEAAFVSAKSSNNSVDTAEIQTNSKTRIPKPVSIPSNIAITNNKEGKKSASKLTLPSDAVSLWQSS